MRRLRLQADADLRQAIVTGVRRRNHVFEFHLGQVFPDGTPDRQVLLYAQQNDLVLVSSDVSTMPLHFREFRQTHDSPGVILVPQRTPIDEAIQSLCWVIEHLDSEEMRNQIWFLSGLATRQGN